MTVSVSRKATGIEGWSQAKGLHGAAFQKVKLELQLHNIRLIERHNVELYILFT